MRDDIGFLAESCGFRPCEGGYRLVEQGVVASLIKDDRFGFVMRHAFLGDGARELYEDPMSLDEACGFLKAVKAASAQVLGHGHESGEKVTYKTVLQQINPEHWRRDRTIANRYSLPQMGGEEHDRQIVGGKNADPRVAKLAGRTFWQRPKVPGGYIDDLPNGARNG